jgi:hypothetical protein
VTGAPGNDNNVEQCVLNEDGSVAANNSLAKGSGTSTGRLSLLGSAESEKVLVPWSKQPLSGRTVDLTWLVRLQCGLP